MQLKQKHVLSLKQWVGGLMRIKVQSLYDLQYLTMELSGYMNAPEEPSLLFLCPGMEYIMQHMDEPIIHSGKNIFKKSYSSSMILQIRQG